MRELTGQKRINRFDKTTTCDTCNFFEVDAPNASRGTCRRLPTTLHKNINDVCGEYVWSIERATQKQDDSLTAHRLSLETNQSLLAAAQTEQTAATQAQSNAGNNTAETAAVNAALSTLTTAQAAVDAHFRVWDLNDADLAALSSAASPTAGKFTVAIGTGLTDPQLFAVTGSSGSFAVDLGATGLDFTTTPASVADGIIAVDAVAQVRDVSDDITPLNSALQAATDAKMTADAALVAINLVLKPFVDRKAAADQAVTDLTAAVNQDNTNITSTLGMRNRLKASLKLAEKAFAFVSPVDEPANDVFDVTVADLQAWTANTTVSNDQKYWLVWNNDYTEVKLTQVTQSAGQPYAEADENNRIAFVPPITDMQMAEDVVKKTITYPPAAEV